MHLMDVAALCTIRRLVGPIHSLGDEYLRRIPNVWPQLEHIETQHINLVCAEALAQLSYLRSLHVTIPDIDSLAVVGRALGQCSRLHTLSIHFVHVYQASILEHLLVETPLSSTLRHLTIRNPQRIMGITSNPSTFGWLTIWKSLGVLETIKFYCCRALIDMLVPLGLGGSVNESTVVPKLSLIVITFDSFMQPVEVSAVAKVMYSRTSVHVRIDLPLSNTSITQSWGCQLEEALRDVHTLEKEMKGRLSFIQR